IFDIRTWLHSLQHVLQKGQQACPEPLYFQFSISFFFHVNAHYSTRYPMNIVNNLPSIYADYSIKCHIAILEHVAMPDHLQIWHT
ncbi:13839_t:CDS:2, partial [Gigaspora margarita]